MQDGRRRYRITAKGIAEVEGWLGGPVQHESASRSEVVIKVAVAMSVPGTDVCFVLDAQRASTLKVRQTPTKAKRATDDKTAALAVEWTVLGAEAEICWLDLCEAELTATESRGSRTGSSARNPIRPPGNRQGGSADPAVRYRRRSPEQITTGPSTALLPAGPRVWCPPGWPRERGS